jgi:hypothetical protein
MLAPEHAHVLLRFLLDFAPTFFADLECMNANWAYLCRSPLSFTEGVAAFSTSDDLGV